MDGYLGLGSNLGDPVVELREALVELRARGVEILRRSSLYHTEPVDAPGGDWFVNAVVNVRFGGDPEALLNVCHAVESRRGRSRVGPKNGPRILDVDILLLGDVVLRSEALTVPHPRLHERRFVLAPLSELAPELVHPLLRSTIRELLRVCSDASKVVRLQDTLV